MSDDALSDLQRRVANMVRRGVIHSVRHGQQPACRVELGDIITAWLPLCMGFSGANRTESNPCAVGDPVTVLSEAGELNNGRVLPGGNTGVMPAPEGSDAEHITRYSDGAEFRYNREAHAFTLTLPEGGTYEIIGMSDKATVRAWTFFAGGFRIQGAHEYTPPELSIVKTDLRTGAQDAPTPMDDGMEALICQIKFYGIDTDMLTRFGFVTGNRNRFAAYEGYLSNGRALGSIDEIEGFVSKITPDARDNQALSEKATTVEIAINYYKQTFEGRELFEIDTERFIRRVNGVDQLRGIAAKIRL